MPVSSARAAWPFAVADFDGDSLPDFASVQVGESAPSFTQYWIHFRLSSGPRVSVRVTAPVGGLHIAPRDVNGDRFPDLIVTTALWHEPVTVLVNDGHGNFASREPAAFSAAIWDCDTVWFSTESAPREISGAIPQRNFSAVCGSPDGGVSAFDSRRLLLPRDLCDAPFRAPSSFFGRAPPRLLPL